MREEHLKGWLVEAHKEEAAVARAKETEGVVAEIRVPGGGYTEERRATDIKEMTHCQKVVALVRADFGEGRLAE